MIAIVDYGMGNLRSVQKGFEKAGFTAHIVHTPEAVKQARGIVLPGVGAFKDAMNNLQSLGMIEAIYKVIDMGKPFLGICLGKQLLFETSEEWGLTKGLGVFRGRVRRLPKSLKVPHMGWNQVEIQHSCPLLERVPDRSFFYFVHSYYVAPEEADLTVGLTEYGIKFASITGRANIFGIQFHPEKSSIWGLKVLSNFGRLIEKW